jgi:hypothetical protein
MSIGNWRVRRVLVFAFAWMFAIVITSIVHAALWARQATPPSTDEVYVVVHMLGGPWLMFGPPALLLATWWAVRRLHRPAS